jgi:alanyl-tRNA synthetase
MEVLTGREALYYLIGATQKAEEVASALRVEVEQLSEAVDGLQEEVREAREASREQALKKGLEEVSSLVESAEHVDGAEIVTGQVVAADVKGLRQISDDIKNRLSGPSAVVLAATLGDKAVLIANLHPEVSRKIGAGEIVREASSVLGGRGGGSPTMGQGGGGEVAAIPQALLKARHILGQRLADTAKG